MQPGNVDGVFTVSEEQIKKAMGIMMAEFGFAVEPSAAVPVAAVLYSTAFARRMASFRERARVGIILTGGNISVDDFLTILSDQDLSFLSAK